MNLTAKTLMLRLTAVFAAVAVTVAAACLASARAERAALQVTGQLSQRQVIILDAGHGASY